MNVHILQWLTIPTATMGKKWQIQAELYTLFLCHTCCISFVTGIYFVALLGTKQVGSSHNVSDLYVGSVYSKSSLDHWVCWDFHSLLQSLQATTWILWSLPFYAFLYINHYFNTPTECTLCICYIYCFYQISLTRFGVLRTILRENFVCLPKTVSFLLKDDSFEQIYNVHVVGLLK